MKTLYLARHAKSSWKDRDLDDIDRPLNKRGRRNAPDMAHRLQARNAKVDRVISSPALRALTTARSLVGGMDFDPKRIATDDRLYFRGIHAQLDIIREQPVTVDALMIAGHNPDTTSLLNFLCGYQTENVPTCAVATIRFDCNWNEIMGKDGVLVDYDFPKKEHS